MPKVSVIVPVYGVEKYIERCARSLFEQTLDDIEFIFVDDCTKDNSIAILEKTIDQYPNRASQTRIIHHEVNKGLPVARQTGLKYAKGEYIAHCDSDDWVDVNMYKSMYEKAIVDNCDVVICNYYSSDGTMKKEASFRSYSSKEELINALLFQNCSWAVWNKLIKRTLYDDKLVYPKDNMGEDMVLTIQFILNCNKITFINKPFYYYYSNPKSITGLAPSKETCLHRFEQYNENFKLVEKILTQQSNYREYEHALNWIRYAIKSFLYYPDKAIREKRKGLYRFVEFRILFYPEVSFSRKKEAIINAVRSIFI